MNKVFFSVYALGVFAGLSLHAAPGDLDATFNALGVKPGTVLISIDNLSDKSAEAYSVAIQQDGKIVVSGYGAFPAKFSAARFMPDGSLDVSFNSSGPQPGTKTITIDNATTENVSEALAIQPDGKMLLAGYSIIGGVRKIALARLLSNGDLDTSFNAGGIQPGTVSSFIENSMAECRGTSIALQCNGKIVVAGVADVGGSYQLSVARFMPNGILDTSFNASGIQPGTVSTTIDNLLFGSAGNSVVVQEDGKIVVAGIVDLGTYYNVAVARFLPNGLLDTSFNTSGVQPGTVSTTIDNQMFYNEGRSVVIQEDGKILVAGYVTDENEGVKMSLVRFNADGLLDVSFNSLGIQPGTVSTSIDNEPVAGAVGQSVALQADGKIVVAGSVFSAGTGIHKVAVARFLSNADLDITFNSTGLQPGTVSTTIQNSGKMHLAKSVAIQSDGKIVAAGCAKVGLRFKVGVVRFLA